MNGLRRPRRQILGSDVAGRVEAVGKDHTDFRPGDEVFGEMESYSGGFAEATGRLVPVIDRTYSLNEVPDALRQLGAGRVNGKIVITVDEGPTPPAPS
jgi:NADPH:quinone reductase-like Zn-dependent oxidoreductase